MKPLAGLARAFTAMRSKLYRAPVPEIAGIDSTHNWPSALQPVQPIGPKGSQPLAFSYWQGINQSITPRPDSALTFADLREMATYPLARICIENVKDTISSLTWSIQLKEVPGESLRDRRKRQENDKTIPKLTEFFSYPDGETPWSEWIRPLLEDLLVIDAPSLLVQRNFGGDVAKLRVIDGSNILRLVTDEGFTPDGDQWAYTQLWEGIPRVALTTRQLVYRPSNIAFGNTLTSKLYGTSITQQLAPEIRIGQERLRYVLAFYAEGAVPGIVHVVPKGTSVDTIRETMEWMNSELAGNLSARRQWRMIQGFREADDAREDQIIQLKEPVLADAFDDLHIRKIAFGYGTSAQRLLKMMNRAASESNQDSAEKEGTIPRVKWLKGTVDLIIQRQMGYPGYEWVPDLDTELDPSKQAEVDKAYVDNGTFTRNEIRDMRGAEARPEPEASQLMITTPTGAVPLDGSTDRTNAAADADVKQKITPKPAPAIPGNEPVPSSKKKLRKSSPTDEEIVIDAGELTPRNRKFEEDLTFRIDRFFQGQRKTVGKQVMSIYRKQRKAKKSITPEILNFPEYIGHGLDGTDETDDEKINRHMREAAILLAGVSWGWTPLSEEVREYLNEAMQEGAYIGEGQMPAADPAVTVYAIEASDRYASARSAEMVGMKRGADGELVDNPDARWAISDTTRKELQKTIAQALDEGWTPNQLEAVINASFPFSVERANLIAHTELMAAQSLGTYTFWIAEASVQTVEWATSGEENTCIICLGFEAQGEVPLGHEFAPGIRHPLAHPRCDCSLRAKKRRA
jgi:hypothetical protein